MSHARNIGGYFHSIREANARNLTNRGVRLSRSFRGHFRADAALERRRIIGRTIFKRIETARQSEHARLGRFILATSLGELVDGGH